MAAELARFHAMFGQGVPGRGADPPRAGSTHDMAALRPGDPDLGAVTAPLKDLPTPPGRKVTVRAGLGRGWPGGGQLWWRAA